MTAINSFLKEDTQQENVVTEDTQQADVVTESQMNLLQDMILEMKEGFQNALGELIKIQNKEEAEANHSKQLRRQQQHQLDHLTETIGDIKHQLSSLTKSVEQIREEQELLKDHLEIVRCSNRNMSQESKLHSDKGSCRTSLLDDLSAHSDELYTVTSKLPPSDGDHTVAHAGMNRSSDDITAIACKSLSLTQALGEECLKLSHSQSSNDEEEDEEILRMSSYRQQRVHHVFDPVADGRLNMMSVSAGVQDRNRHVGSAAQRQKAVTELADSERDYCSQIWSLLHTYLTPLQTAGFLSAEELDILFSPHLEQLYVEHCHICTGLQDKLVHWSHMTTVTDILVRITQYHNPDSLLSLYKEYTDDLPEALTCLRRALARSSELRLFLKAAKRSSCHSEDLMSLILAPVQRMPKYLLQLQEVSCHTPSTHTDYPHLQTMLHQLQNFVDELNDGLLSSLQEWNYEGHTRSDHVGGHNRSDVVDRCILSSRIRDLYLHSPEDNSITSARDLSKVTKSYMSAVRLENVSYNAHQRQQLAPSGRISALSQPDLTVYNNVNNQTVDRQMYTHIPRSQSTLHAGTDGSAHDVTRHQGQKFKIKIKHQSPVGYLATSQNCINHSTSPCPRSSSAIDFNSQAYHPHQQFYKHSINTEQSRNYQHPSSQSRPHTALGLHALKSYTRPVVISRRNIRQSQPLISTSNTLWTETTASRTLPTPVGYQRPHLEVHDLMPVQHQHQQMSNFHKHEDGENDSTRTSDTNSLGNSGSHPHSHDQGSYDGPKLEPENRDHVNEQSPGNNGLAYDSTCSKFNYFTTNATRNPHSAQQGNVENDEYIEGTQANRVVINPKILKKQLSKTLINKMKDNAKVKEHLILRDSKEIDKAISNSTHSTKLDLGECSEKDIQHGSLLPSREKDNHQSSSSTLVQTNSNHEHSASVVSGNNGTGVNGSEHFSEINKQFLLSLANRNSSAGRFDPNKTVPTNSKSKTDIERSKELSGENNYPQSNSHASESHSSDFMVKTCRVSPHPPPRSSRARDSHLRQISAVKDISDTARTMAVPFKRHSQPLVSYPANNKDDVGVSSDITRPSFPLKYEQDLFQTLLSASSQTSSVVSPNTSSLSQVSSFLSNHQSPDKSSPQFASSTTCSVDVTSYLQGGHVHTTRSMDGHANNYGDNISYSYTHDLLPQDVTDLNDLDERKQLRRKENVNEIEDEGNVAPAESMDVFNDNRVSTKKKTNFKASFKNLFAKKKGQVILADVEREVMLEIASATTTSLTATAPTNCSYSRMKKVRNFRCSHFLWTCKSHTRSGEVFHIKTWKDQASSTSSPVKVCKKLNFFTNHDKLTQASTDSRELNSVDCNTLQKASEHLKTGKNQQGICDSQLGSKLDIGNDCMCSLGLDSCSKRHLYNQEKHISSTPSSAQQSHEKETVVCSAEGSGLRLHGKPVVSLDKKMLSQFYLKSDPKTSNNFKKNTVHNNNKDAVMNSNISENKVNSQKLHSQHHREFDFKKSQSSSHILCQQCQMYETRQMEESGVTNTSNKIDHSARKNCELKVACNGSHEHARKAIQNLSSHENKSEKTAAHSGLLLPRIDEQKTLMTEKIRQRPHFTTGLDSFKPHADNLLLCGSGKSNKMENMYLSSCQNHRQRMDKQWDISREGSLSPIDEQLCSRIQYQHQVTLSQF